MHRTILIICLAWAAPCVLIDAQIEAPGPFHLSHLGGVVVNQSGMPVEHAEITLAQDEKIVYSTRTDAKGHFEFKNVTGRYLIEMHVPTYSIVSREVIVGFEIVTALEGNKLYVILGPGACSDDCSSVFTSKREFNQALRRMSAHNR
ncbi:MAG: carboxypeptidase-like regulatory domain-containing protein [Terracidiphilus sp.]